MLEPGITLPHGINQCIEVLVDQPVRTDIGIDFLDIALMRDQLAGHGHVYAIDIGITHRRCGRCQVNPFGARLARHLHDLARGGSAHDGVIHQQYRLVLEFEINDIELLAHAAPALFLPRHDESAPHIAVFDKSLAERHSELLRQRQCRRPARLRYRDHHIDIVVGPLLEDLLGQLFPHPQPGLVHGDAVHERIRTREVDIFEQAGNQFGLLRHDT